MPKVTLESLAKMLNQVAAANSVSNWATEDEAAKFFGMRAKTLAKYREDFAHKDGWRYRGDGVSKDEKTIRRGIMWNKQYILDNILKQVA